MTTLAPTTAARQARPTIDRIEPGTILDGSRPPVEVASRPYQSLTTVLPSSLFDRTKKPPASAYRVAYFLQQECERFTAIHGRWQVGCWPSTYSIALATGYSESTVRDTALRWLQEENEVALQEVSTEDGDAFLMIWCKWRGPGVARGVEPPTGGGSNLKVDRPDRAAVVPIRANSRPKRACSHITGHAPIARNPLRETAPNVGSEFETIPEKTTTGTDQSLLFLSAAPSGGGEEDPVNIPPVPGATPPAPTPGPVAEVIDPRISAVLAELPEADRPRAIPQIRAKVATLRPLPIERIMEAMRRLLIAANVKRAPIDDYGLYLGGILVKMEREDELAATRKPKDSRTNCPSEAEQEARRAERRRGDAREDAWFALPEAEKAALMARYDREYPPRPGMPPFEHRGLRTAWCKENFDQLEASP